MSSSPHFLNARRTKAASVGAIDRDLAFDFEPRQGYICTIFTSNCSLGLGVAEKYIVRCGTMVGTRAANRHDFVRLFQMYSSMP
jgi:hypothetical protein